MNKKFFSFIIILNLILASGSSAFAVSDHEEASNLKQTREQKKEIQQRVQKIDNEIDSIISEIDKNKEKMNQVNKDVKNTEDKLVEVKENVKVKEKLFARRVRAIYINGGDSYLDILLDSKSLSDFMSRIDTVAKIMNFDKDVVDKLKEQKQSILKQKENLDKEKQKLEGLKKDNEVALSKLNRNVSEEKAAFSKISEQEEKLVASEAEKSKKAEENSKINKEVASSNTSSGTLSRGESSSGSYSKSMMMTATAYSGHSATAYGPKPVRNPQGYSTIAVDPRVIPLGTRVYVEGYGYAIAHDTGGAIIGNKIDLFMNSESECNSWGRRTVKVYVIR